MKNKFTVLAVILVLLALVLGCGSLIPRGGKSTSPNTGGANSTDSNATSTSDGSDEPVVVEKTGVQECDDLMDFIVKQSKSPDDNYFTKAAREFAFNRVREALRKSIEEEKGNPEELAKKCTEFKKQLETFKSREDEQKGEK